MPFFGIKAQVTDSELNTYRAFCRDLFRDHFRKKPRTTLWHYASARTFIEIIGSGKVWATQISCLNDHTEFRYSVGLVRDAMKPFLEGTNKTHKMVAEKIS